MTPKDLSRNDKNRRLAEWLGWTELSDQDGTWSLWGINPQSGYRTKAPDFYTSEEASALLLEKMPQVSLKHFREPEEWVCFWDEEDGRCHAAVGKDRKTAIAEAALALIAAERGKS